LGLKSKAQSPNKGFTVRLLIGEVPGRKQSRTGFWPIKSGSTCVHLRFVNEFWVACLPKLGRHTTHHKGDNCYESESSNH